MRCEIARNLMSAYIDDEINQIEKKALEKHISECAECREEYELLLEVVTDCGNIEEKELPQGFGEELHQKLVNEKSSAKASNKIINLLTRNNKWKIASGLVAAALVVTLAVGGAYSYILDKKGIDIGKGEMNNYSLADRGAPSGDTASYGTSNAAVGSPAPAANEKKVKMTVQNKTLAAPTNPETAPAAEGVVGGAAPNVGFTVQDVQPAGQNLMAARSASEGRKVIKAGNINLKVEKLDDKVDAIKKLAEQNGGYVENSSISNVPIYTVPNPESSEVIDKSTVKTANIAIRVPADSFNVAFDAIKTMGVLDNENVNGSDITYQYRDTYTRAENLKVQEKRLLDLMGKAKNVDELLRIESELNRIRTDIEMMTGDLKRWDDLVELSTISINLTEVREGELNRIDVPNVWSKAYKGFIGAINKILYGIEKLFVFIITAIPYLIILGIIAVAAIFAIRRIRSKRKTE